ncbi:MAG: SDR family oxidoreductase [Acidimicrobiales bacterium]
MADVAFDLPTDALRGKVAVITGASRGLGAGLAHRFAAHGLQLGLCARHEPDAPAGARALTGAVDVTDARTLDRFASAVASTLGPIDLWVNNAGVLDPMGPQRRHDPAVDRALLVNVGGVASGAQLHRAVPGLGAGPTGARQRVVRRGRRASTRVVRVRRRRRRWTTSPRSSPPRSRRCSATPWPRGGRHRHAGRDPHPRRAHLPGDRAVPRAAGPGPGARPPGWPTTSRPPRRDVGARDRRRPGARGARARSERPDGAEHRREDAHDVVDPSTPVSNVQSLGAMAGARRS